MPATKKENPLKTLVRLAPILLLLASCSTSSTKIVSAWKLPETGPLQFERIMALVLVQEPSIRRAGEQALVQQITRAKAVPSYTILNESQLANEEQVKRAVSESGVDGIVVMRPVYNDEETRYVGGSYPTSYYSFYGYYGWAHPISYSPGYYQTDRLVGVETNIYDTSDGKLVWSGLTQTTNPTDVRKLVADTAKKVRQEMRKYGFIS